MSSSLYFLSSSQGGRGLQVVTTGSSVAPEPGQSHCMFTWHRSVTNQRPVLCHLTNQRAQGQWAAAKEYLQPAFKLPEIFLIRNLRFVLNKSHRGSLRVQHGGRGRRWDTFSLYRYNIKLIARYTISKKQPEHLSNSVICQESRSGEGVEAAWPGPPTPRW